MALRSWSVKRINGVHWLVAPDGRRMVYTSVQCAGPKHGSRVPGAPAYDGLKDNGGSLLRWVEQTERRLKAWGMKGLGAWNHALWRYRATPYTECLNIWKSLWVKGKLKSVFDPDWEKAVEDHVRPQIRELKLAPSLVGWFLDNEIPWGLHFLDDNWNGRTPGDPARRAVLAFLKGRHRTITRLNRAWGSHARSWGALARSAKLPAPPDRSRTDRLAFLGLVARRFFATTCRVVRTHDPDRLILGVRYAGFPLDPVVAAQKGRTDVVSMNLYIQEGEFPAAQAWRAHRLSGGQPVWVTEFSWHAPYDNRSGDRNTIGFGSRVRRQGSRGRGYGRFVAGGASLPFVIGFDWFQWCDESPKGRGDGEDVNFGLVDIRNRPYDELVRAIAGTNRRLDRLHAGSAGRRPPAAVAPVPPFLAAPRLESRASGSAGAAVGGLKFRPSLDRLPPRVPVQARVGWRPDALVVNVDVADPVRTVETAKPRKSIEWFWMTDAVELLLRPGAEDVEALDAKSLKVWAIPDGAGRNRPEIGAWRNHVRITGAKTGVRAVQRSRRGGYRMEFRVPARALGLPRFKPFAVLRFNLLVEDCDQVREVCWSGHQGEWTTERPGTWGRVALVP